MVEMARIRAAWLQVVNGLGRPDKQGSVFDAGFAMLGHDCNAAASKAESCLRFAAYGGKLRMRVSGLLFKLVVLILGPSRIAPC
jgi:hypothetical protein